jgi:hypothetical protein
MWTLIIVLFGSWDRIEQAQITLHKVICLEELLPIGQCYQIGSAVNWLQLQLKLSLQYCNNNNRFKYCSEDCVPNVSYDVDVSKLCLSLNLS